MVFFITVLRALAACLITNAHYTGIYPTDLIANGGLLGDVIFFAVSGYCLACPRTSFPSWYGRRLYRVYPPVLLITGIYACLGFYTVTADNWVQWFVYPTYYHFVASILILYIPFWFCMRSQWCTRHPVQLMLLTAAVWMAIYLGVYDRSRYHIDNVYEPMIRFLFLESMLLGAYFRNREAGKRSLPVSLGGTGVFFVLYFAAKLLFSRRAALAPWQFVNQILIFALLYFVFRLFSELDPMLNRLPRWAKRILQFVSDRTLEIYVVQYAILDRLRNVSFFPINWILVTSAIIVSAVVLHWLCSGLYRLSSRLGIRI